MPSFTTIYRAFVMIAVSVIAVKGWQLYGPTNEQVKSMGQRTIELATTAWNNFQSGGEQSAAASADPRLTAAPHSEKKTTPPLAPGELVEPAPLFAPTAARPADNAAATLLPAPTRTAPVAANDSEDDTLAAEVNDRLPPLYSRLEALGVSDRQLAAWGSSGQMYRFCCRAALAETPSLTRHFEAVATEPEAAVEQVVAKVEAWRAVEHDGAILR